MRGRFAEELDAGFEAFNVAFFWTFFRNIPRHMKITEAANPIFTTPSNKSFDITLINTIIPALHRAYDVAYQNTAHSTRDKGEHEQSAGFHFKGFPGLPSIH